MSFLHFLCLALFFYFYITPILSRRETDVVWMAAYVSKTYIFFSIKGAFTDVQVTRAMCTNALP